MIDRIDVFYTESVIELPWPIGSSVVYDETKQDNCVIDFLVLLTLEMKLSCYDWLNQVQSIMKTRQGNNLINCIVMVYTENDIELSWLIEPITI